MSNTNQCITLMVTSLWAGSNKGEHRANGSPSCPVSTWTANVKHNERTIPVVMTPDKQLIAYLLFLNFVSMGQRTTIILANAINKTNPGWMKVIPMKIPKMKWQGSCVLQVCSQITKSLPYNRSAIHRVHRGTELTTLTQFKEHTNTTKAIVCTTFWVVALTCIKSEKRFPARIKHDAQ